MKGPSTVIHAIVPVVKKYYVQFRSTKFPLNANNMVRPLTWNNLFTYRSKLQ